MKTAIIAIILSVLMFGGYQLAVSGEPFSLEPFPHSRKYEGDSPQQATDNFTRVARIFGRDIFISDLNPSNDEFKMFKQSSRNSV